MIRIKAIKVSAKDAGLDPQAHRHALELAYKAAAKLALDDYAKTTATWDHGVSFTATTSGDGIGQIVGTDDRIYGYVDEGTRPHMIRPRKARRLKFATGYRAKTSPGVIGSRGGGASGPIAYARAVRHPGSAARNFTAIIRERSQVNILRLVELSLRRAGARG